MNAKLALAGAVLAACVFTAASAERRSLAMLDHLDSGLWELRSRDEPGRAERLCLGDPRKLIQLRHRAQACTPVVVDDTESEVTVQYTCHGQGYGRTHIRRESDSLVQIDSQGIAQGLPFAFAAEARKVGACPR
jgi:hypothetical protein